MLISEIFLSFEKEISHKYFRLLINPFIDKSEYLLELYTTLT